MMLHSGSTVTRKVYREVWDLSNSVSAALVECPLDGRFDNFLQKKHQKLFREKSQQSLSCIHFDKHLKRTNPAFWWFGCNFSWEVSSLDFWCVEMGRLLELAQSTRSTKHHITKTVSAQFALGNSIPYNGLLHFVHHMRWPLWYQMHSGRLIWWGRPGRLWIRP